MNHQQLNSTSLEAVLRRITREVYEGINHFVLFFNYYG